MDLYISPHPDDVILSCGGRLIKETGPKTVLTVFSGSYTGRTDWDKLCGLKVNPMKTRIKEDKKILSQVEVVSIYLDFYDNAVYQDLLNKKPPRERSEKIERKIKRVIDRLSPERIFCPYGITHPDHKLISTILKKVSGNLIFYEDFPYSIKSPLKKGVLFKFSNAVLEKKINLILGYESQLGGLLRLSDSETAEEFISKTKTHHFKSGGIGEDYLIEK